MSLKLGTLDIAGISVKEIYNANNLFDFKWTDYLVGDMNWLRADTYSWQDGTTYSNAYQHLVTDISGITSETETIGSYTVTFYRATDGHKVCLADQEQTVLDIYTETGVSWYYVLDTTNTQFKLPRTKYGFNGLRNSVGNYVPETLPQHTHTTSDVYVDAAASKVFQSGTNRSGYFNMSYVTANRTTSNASGTTYQLSAPVQERATQMYLYCYVGQFSQTATEQTAGLNAELFNGKADIDLTNCTDVANIKMAHNAMPSSLPAVNLTFTHGATYTAPADGYFYMGGYGGTAGSVMALSGPSLSSGINTTNNTSAGLAYVYLPAKKGDVIHAYLYGGTVTFLRFIYAQGSESEAS